MTQGIDTIYSDSATRASGFVFDEKVSRVFSDMIRRSVPGYKQILSSLSIITARYAREDSNLYDLGCSLGGATLAMLHGVGDKNCHIIGIDNSKAMIERCQKLVDTDKNPTPVTIKYGDICDEPVSNASVVVLNFTLQFISLEQRLPLLKRIYDGMCPEGVLVLSEKLVFNEPEQAVLEALQLDFKRANGYSELEISRKREAIANVLIPESFQTHKQRLQEAGFNHVMLWLQHFNFASILAIK